MPEPTSEIRLEALSGLALPILKSVKLLDSPSSFAHNLQSARSEQGWPANYPRGTRHVDASWLGGDGSSEQRQRRRGTRHFEQIKSV